MATKKKIYRVVSPPGRDDPPEGFPVCRVVDGDGATVPGKQWFVGDTMKTGDVSADDLAWYIKIGVLEADNG